MTQSLRRFQIAVVVGTLLACHKAPSVAPPTEHSRPPVVKASKPAAPSPVKVSGEATVYLSARNTTALRLRFSLEAHTHVAAAGQGTLKVQATLTRSAAAEALRWGAESMGTPLIHLVTRSPEEVAAGLGKRALPYLAPRLHQLFGEGATYRWVHLGIVLPEVVTKAIEHYAKICPSELRQKRVAFTPSASVDTVKPILWSPLSRVVSPQILSQRTVDNFEFDLFLTGLYASRVSTDQTTAFRVEGALINGFSLKVRSSKRSGFMGILPKPLQAAAADAAQELAPDIELIDVLMADFRPSAKAQALVDAATLSEIRTQLLEPCVRRKRIREAREKQRQTDRTPPKVMP